MRLQRLKPAEGMAGEITVTCKRTGIRLKWNEAAAHGWVADLDGEPFNAYYSEPLPAYRVIYADGTSYITSMAKGITLEKARAYFIGQSFEQADGKSKTVANVEEVAQ